MHFCKFLLSFCCIFLLCCLTQCATKDEHKAKQKDIDDGAQSNIYKIKRLDKDTHDGAFKKLKPIRFKHKGIDTVHHPISPISPASGEVTIPEVPPKPAHSKNFKNSHGLNKKLLNKLGFTKVKAPNSHNRKRLAVESRRHASPDDSHMFIIKLPPNAHYYSSPKAIEGVAITNGKTSSPNALGSTETFGKETSVATTVGAIDNGKKVSFNSNGRPGRIYHWNLPIIQKILEDKQRFPNVPNAMKQKLIDIKDTPTWTKPWENETIEKSYGKANMMHNYKKSLKRKSPSYYAPANTVSKNSFNKYFAGNGKPKGFFVIKENQKQPLYYKNIIS